MVFFHRPDSGVGDKKPGKPAALKQKITSLSKVRKRLVLGTFALVVAVAPFLGLSLSNEQSFAFDVSNQTFPHGGKRNM